MTNRMRSARLMLMAFLFIFSAQGAAEEMGQTSDGAAESKHKVLYEDAIIAESLGHIDEAKFRWQTIYSQTKPQDRYHILSRLKLCSYGSVVCERGDLPGTANATALKEIQMVEGESRTINFPELPPDARIGGTLKSAARVKLDLSKKQLQIDAKGNEQVPFTIVGGDGRKHYDVLLTVVETGLRSIAQEIERLCETIDGLEIKIVNRKVVVDGQLTDPKELERVNKVVGLYEKTKVTSLVRLSPSYEKKIAQAIANDINNPEIVVRSLNGQFLLEGSAGDESERQRAETIASKYISRNLASSSSDTGERVEEANSKIVNFIIPKSAPPPGPGKILQLDLIWLRITPKTSAAAKPGKQSSDYGLESWPLLKEQFGENPHVEQIRATTLMGTDGHASHFDLKNLFESKSRVPWSEGLLTAKGTVLNFRSDSVTIDLQRNLNGNGITVHEPESASLTVRSGHSAVVWSIIRGQRTLGRQPASKVSGEAYVLLVRPVIKTSASQGTGFFEEKLNFSNKGFDPIEAEKD